MGTPGSSSRVSMISSWKGRISFPDLDAACGIDLFGSENHAPLTVLAVGARSWDRSANQDGLSFLLSQTQDPSRETRKKG